MRAAARSSAAALSILVGIGCWQPAAGNEASQNLLAEATQHIQASPPRQFEAMEKLRAATQADPQDARAWFVRGGFALTLFLAKEALDSLDKAAALQPDTPNLQFLRGRALSDLQRFKAATAAYEKESNKDGNPNYWFYRGIADKESKNYKQALADFDTSDKSYLEGRALTQLHRGDIHLAQGRVAEAKQAYNLVLTLDPKSPASGTAEERLKMMRAPAAAVRPEPRAPVTAGRRGPRTPPPPPQNFYARTFLGGEYDSNVSLLQSGLPPPPQLRRKGDSRLVTDTTATYYFLNTPLAYAGALGNVRASFHSGDGDYDDALFGASIFGARTFDKFRIGGELRSDRTLVGNSGYSKATNGTIWGSVRFDNRNETLVTYRRRWQTFDTVEVDSRRNRDGGTDYVSVSHAWRPYQQGKEFVELEPGFRFGWERTDGGYFDNDEFAAFVTVRKQVMWYAYPTLFEAGLFYYHRDYVDVAPQIAINAGFGGVREDNNFSQWVRVLHQFGEKLAVEVKYRHANNSSNILGFGYNDHVVRFGLVGWY